MTRSEAMSVARNHKRGGGTVALASGGFDLFHAGHLSFLSALRDEAEILIVAVMSDALLKAKGADRPIIPQEQRLAIVEALYCVEAAFIFDEFGDDANLTLIRPDVFGRGDGHTENMHERETIERLGIKICLIHTPRITSTTEIINRIRQ